MISKPKRLAAVAVAGLSAFAFAIPAHADAATATNQLNLGAGSLAISSMSGSTLNASSVGNGSQSGSVDSATWADTTGSGAGWNGTVQTTQFLLQGPWQQGTGASALTSTASGAYTGTAGAASVVVTISTGGTALNTPFTWVDIEGATSTNGTVSTCANGSACAVSNGVTITFNSATAYTSGWTYTAHVGVLATTALSLATGSAAGPTPNGTTLGGLNDPSFLNNLSTVPTASAVKFVHATAGTGLGSFTLSPGVTITWDPNNTWSSTVSGANYTATATYTITSGP